MIFEIFTKILRVVSVPEYLGALLRSQVFASTEHDDIIRGLQLDTIVDIGANRGQFALCARHLYPRAEIYSFEPLTKPADKYLQVFKHDPHTRLFRKAVGVRSSTASMHVSRWDVSSSLLPIAQAQHDNFPLTEESGRETVSVCPLSECIGPSSIGGTALLKLDVQGYELTALQGCEALLSRFSFVYVEASFIELYVGQALASDVIDYLLGAGFQLVCVANLMSGKTKRPIQADFLFARRLTTAISR